MKSTHRAYRLCLRAVDQPRLILAAFSGLIHIALTAIDTIAVGRSHVISELGWPMSIHCRYVHLDHELSMVNYSVRSLPDDIVAAEVVMHQC